MGNKIEEESKRGDRFREDSIRRVETLGYHSSSVNDIAILGNVKGESSEDSLIISASEDKNLKVYSMKLGVTKSYEHKFPLVSVTCNLDGTILCGDRDGCVLALSNRKLHLRYITTFRVADRFSSLPKIILIDEENKESRDNGLTSFVTYCSSGISKGYIFVCSCNISSGKGRMRNRSKIPKFEINVKTISNLKHHYLNMIYTQKLHNGVLLVSTTSSLGSECIHRVDLNTFFSKNESESQPKRDRKVFVTNFMRFQSQVTCISSFLETKQKELLVIGTLDSVIIANLEGVVIRSHNNLPSPCESLLIMIDLKCMFFGREDGVICLIPFAEEKKANIKKNSVCYDGEEKLNLEHRQVGSSKMDSLELLGSLSSISPSSKKEICLPGSVVWMGRLSKHEFVSYTLGDEGSLFVWSLASVEGVLPRHAKHYPYVRKPKPVRKRCYSQLDLWMP